MTVSGHAPPHDRSGYCGAKKRQPSFPGETCKRPSGWGTPHPGFGRCKLHGGSTPVREGRYSQVVRDYHLPALRLQVRTHFVLSLRSILANLISDPVRREQLVQLVLKEAGMEGVLPDVGNTNRRNW